MRPIELAFGLLAGAAVNLILIPVRRRRRRRQQNALTSPSRRRVVPTRPHHRAILAKLDVEAPLKKAKLYEESGHDCSFDCTFCLDSILSHPDAYLRLTKCGHLFHSECLESWVIYSADICLDWTQYTVSEDGRIGSQVRMPTCPNCTAELDVIPDALLRATVLTAVARSLSLRDLSVAAEMYNAGVVYREGTERLLNNARPSHAQEASGASAFSSTANATERLPRRYSGSWIASGAGSGSGAAAAAASAAASASGSATAPRSVERAERATSSGPTGSAERIQRRQTPSWVEAASFSSRSLEYLWRPRSSNTNVGRRDGESRSTASEAMAFVPGGVGRRRNLPEPRVGLGIASRVALQAPS